MLQLLLILAILLLINFIIGVYFYGRMKIIQGNYNKLLSQKKSSEVVLGQIAEQLAPFTDNFKYEPHKVKFLGQPIDYIYFGDDKIVIIEVKSGNSKLTQKQTQIKYLIKEKKVYWEEFRIPEKLSKPKPEPTKPDES